jgi:cystathionine beta-lyase
MKERLSHPAFGYYIPPQSYYDSIIGWMNRRHGVEGLTKECIGYENGVLGGVVSALNVLCSRGDRVLLHSPAYIGFTGVLKNNGYQAVFSPLIRDEDEVWRMDFADMEEKIRDNGIHTAIFCSPHNPCGRVWTRDELEQAYALFKKYDVRVISDEIWSDLMIAGHKHIPSLSVSEDATMRTIALYAPSKTFNLAGLIGSYHIILNHTLQDRMKKETSLSYYNSMNVLSMHALIGAYSREGEAWADALCGVLTQNVRYAVDFIRTHFPGVRVFEPEGTYMLFLDCEEWCRKQGCTLGELERAGWRVGVAWQDGEMFHGPWSIRMNLALPLSRVQEAFERLRQHVFTDSKTQP